MNELLDLVLAGSRIAAWVGVGLIAAAVAVLWWLAIRAWRRAARPVVRRVDGERIPRVGGGRRG